MFNCNMKDVWRVNKINKIKFLVYQCKPRHADYCRAKILKCIAVLRYQRSMEGKYNQLNEIKLIK